VAPVELFQFANKKVTAQIVPIGKVKVITWKVYGRHHDLVNRYGIYVSQMTTDMLQTLPGHSCLSLLYTVYISSMQQ
jgi:hypothetical protein